MYLLALENLCQQSYCFNRANKLKMSCLCDTFHVSCPAEKVTSLGKDWHRPCLKCERCKKTLTPGGHAEVCLKLHLSKLS